jgi:hypothetical protein
MGSEEDGYDHEGYYGGTGSLHRHLGIGLSDDEALSSSSWAQAHQTIGDMPEGLLPTEGSGGQQAEGGASSEVSDGHSDVCTQPSFCGGFGSMVHHPPPTPCTGPPL